MRLAICDDDREDDERLLGFVRERRDKHNISLFPSAAKLLRATNADKNAFDLIFLDIRMPEPNGFEAAKLLKESGVGALVVLTTIAQQYVFDSFKLVWDFVVKPVPREKIHKILDDAHIAKALKPMILATDKFQVSVSARDIIFVEVRLNYLFIHTASGEVHRVRETLTEFERALDLPSFSRPHQSYLVNLAHVARIESAQVIMSSRETIPISRHKNAGFHQSFIEFMRRPDYV